MVSINKTGLDDRVEVYSCLEIRKPHTGHHTATEGPRYLLETGDPFGSVHSINVMIQNNGLLGGTSFDYHQDGHALDQPNPECLGYTHIVALYVDSRVCCS